MLKRDEVINNNSCLNKAGDSEMLFVLLARDPAAPEAVRFWAQKRIDLGENVLGDTKIRDAFLCADAMDEQRRKQILDEDQAR